MIMFICILELSLAHHHSYEKNQNFTYLSGYSADSVRKKFIIRILGFENRVEKFNDIKLLARISLFCAYD